MAAPKSLANERAWRRSRQDAGLGAMLFVFRAIVRLEDDLCDGPPAKGGGFPMNRPEGEGGEVARPGSIRRPARPGPLSQFRISSLAIFEYLTRTGCRQDLAGARLGPCLLTVGRDCLILVQTTRSPLVADSGLSHLNGVLCATCAVCPGKVGIGIAVAINGKQRC